MILEGKAGQRNVSDNAEDALRLGRYGGLAVMDAHGRYMDAVIRGNVFLASQQAAAAFGTALTLSAVTLTLYNPTGSGKILVLLQTTLSIATSTLAGQVVYAVNDTAGQAVPSATTALTIRNALLGAGNGSVMRAFSAATLPAIPQAARVLAGIISTAPTNVHSIVDDVAGGLCLYPGSILTVQGITTNATGIIAAMWEEVVP